jgi:cytoskeletal protein CcmA (bactofilin family)
MGFRKRNKKAPAPATKQRPPAERPQSAPAAAPRPPRDTSSNAANIGRSVKVTGELSGNEELTIEGTVDGNVTISGNSVAIAEGGTVRGEVRAGSVVIEGTVIGDVTAKDKVEVATSGSLQGDIHAARVVLAEGARFKGKIDMGAQTSVAPARTPQTGNTTDPWASGDKKAASTDDKPKAASTSDKPKAKVEVSSFDDAAEDLLTN